MPTYQEIYERHADAYDALVSREDKDRNLPAALAAALARGGARPRRIVELGAGTGRVTRLLAGLADEVRAYDGSAHMIEGARARLADAPSIRWGVADNAALPEPDGEADGAVAGWTIGHVTGFHPDAWQAHARAALAEMRRVVRPGGVLVVIETLGTGQDHPAPPNERLAAFYAMLEADLGFARVTIDTSYAFADAAEAERVLGFFFGERMASVVRARGAGVIPEWTGVWSAVIGG